MKKRKSLDINFAIPFRQVITDNSSSSNYKWFGNGTIDMITILDQNLNGTGGFVDNILAGGLGTNHLAVDFQNAGFGIHFIINIYGTPALNDFIDGFLTPGSVLRYS